MHLIPPLRKLTDTASRAAPACRRFFVRWTIAQILVVAVAVAASTLFAARARDGVSRQDAAAVSSASGALSTTLSFGRGVAALPPLGLIRFSPGFGGPSTGVSNRVAQGAAGAKMLEILFGSQRHTWVVGLQNPSEMRATGGLIGSWATVSTGEGMPDLLSVNRIRALFKPSGAPLQVNTASVDADEPVMRVFGSRTRVQNVNVVPDMPTVGAEFLAAYEASRETNPELGPPADGVILLDTKALELFLEITGPLAIPGIDAPVTADNVERVTLLDLYVTYEDEGARATVLEALVRTLWSALLAADVSPSTQLLDHATRAIEDGNIQMWSADEDLERLVESIGMDGAWPQPDGLALGFIGQNIAGNKVDQFLDRKISVDVGEARLPNGSDATRTKITIELVNNAPATGLPPYILGPHETVTSLLGPGDNRQMYTVYTSDPWTALTVDGKSVSGQSLRDGRWWVTRLVTKVPQGGSATIEVTTLGAGSPKDEVNLTFGVNSRPTTLACAYEGSATTKPRPVYRSASCPLR